MQPLSTFALCTLLVAGIRSESGSLGSSSIYKDGHHDFVQQFHHAGQPHGSEVVSNSGSVTHLVPNSQIQDQSGVRDDVRQVVGQVGQNDQIGQVPSQVSPLGHISAVHGHPSPLIPVPYVGQRPDLPVHAGARAIGAPVPVSYYPYFGKTYASPVYGQYQQAPHQGIYQQQVYPYHVTPYSATPYSGVPVPSPAYSGYPHYHYPYYPQYIPGVPYYNQQSGEVQSVTKQ